jgi:hypothetical protein
VPGSRPRDKASLHITHSITHIITEPATRPCRPGLIGPPGLARIDRRKGSTSKAFSRSFNILLSHRSSWRRTGRVSSQLSVERLAVRPHAQAPVRRRPTTHRRARLRKLDANASVGSRSRSREVLNADQPGHEPNTPRHRATCVHVQSVLAPRRLSPPIGRSREPMFVLGSPGADKYPCHPFRVPAQAPRRLTQHPQAPGAGAL